MIETENFRGFGLSSRFDLFFFSSLFPLVYADIRSSRVFYFSGEKEVPDPSSFLRGIGYQSNTLLVRLREEEE